MARIRTVKPELFRHEALYEAELEYKLPLRLAFIGLFTCCDRKGRFHWRPRRLKLDIFPYDNIDFSIVLDVLHTCSFVMKYQYKGEIYGCVPSWSEHQYINNREMASKLPAVEESTFLEIKKLNINKDLNSDLTRDFSPHKTSRTVDKEASGLKQNIEDGGPSKKKDGMKNLEASHQIFEHWKTVMNHPHAKLDQKRKAIIIKALQFGYGIDELCEAITGCGYTPHNMGDNDRGQRYDGLHVILRDGDQIDRFIHNCKFPPKPITEADRRTMANVATLQNWASKKIVEEP